MPGFTVNRGYPYSLPADPADVPQAIEDLARAVDSDVQALSTAIRRRPFCKVSSQFSEPQTFPAGTDTVVTFDFVDVDTDSISNLSQLSDRLIPTSAGLWMAYAAIQVPSAAVDLYAFGLRRNGAQFARQGVNQSSATESAVVLSVSGPIFMNGTGDYFTVTLNPGGAFEDFKISYKQLACFRLTNT